MSTKIKDMSIRNTARQKALYDYNTLMEERFSDGYEQGTEHGIITGRKEERNNLIAKWKSKGYTDEQIQDLYYEF